MKAYNKKYVYVSSDIEKNSETYNIIENCICGDLKSEYCRIIRDEDLLVLIEGSQNKGEEIRFGCVTPETEISMIAGLLKNIIPVLFFGPDEKKRYEILTKLKIGIDLNLLNEMLYNIGAKDELKEIRGAIKWVHFYYYHLREKREEIEKEREKFWNYFHSRIEKEHSAYKKTKAMEMDIAYSVLRKV